MLAPSTNAFRLNPLLSKVVPASVATMLAPPLEAMLSLRRLERFYTGLPPTTGPIDFAQQALTRLDVRFDVEGAVAGIPVEGPLVVVANHPFGAIEGLFLYGWLSERRGDVRVLGNHLLGRLPELAPAVFTVDVLAGRSAAARNGTALKQAIRWVGGGGALLVFPAGEVATFEPMSRTIVDPAWSPSVARIISLARAPVVPIYIDGGNSPLFHAAGMIHPRLRTALLPRELWNKRHRTICVHVGGVIPSARLEAINGDGPRIEHLRLCTYALACEDRPGLPADDAPAEPMASVTGRRPARAPVAIAPEGARDVLAREIEGLPVGQRLGANGDLEVWSANAATVPWVMQEIGRLRELTFRAVGEGTGRERDIDLFDTYYDQLFVWNRATHEVVGGYRIGPANRIARRYGLRGLYTSTLFRFHKALLPSLGNALELGRSFVRPEYQRSFAPLLLLWKGIATYLVRNPEYRTLFGPVSISNAYSPAARALLTGFLGSPQHGDNARGKLARARHPLPAHGGARLVRREAAEVGSLDALETAVMACEADGKGVPVLLRQYLKLGARAIAFNVDPAFGHSIDVLVAVDLLATDEKVLLKYMGRAGAEAYLAAQRR